MMVYRKKKTSKTLQKKKEFLRLKTTKSKFWCSGKPLGVKSFIPCQWAWSQRLNTMTMGLESKVEYHDNGLGVKGWIPWQWAWSQRLNTMTMGLESKVEYHDNGLGVKGWIPWQWAWSQRLNTMTMGLESKVEYHLNGLWIKRSVPYFVSSFHESIKILNHTTNFRSN